MGQIKIEGEQNLAVGIMGVKPKGPRPVIARRLSDQVEQEILLMLQAGEYVPGDRLPSERELMGFYDVGRSSIREALFSLQRKGFLKISRGDRPRVIELAPKRMIAEFTDVVGMVLSRPDGILHFNQVRSFFEASIARFAAENAKPDNIKSIEVALRANRNSIGDFQAFRETDIGFHRAVAESANNPIVFGIYDALVEWVISKRVLHGDLETNNRSSIVAHERIFECIRNGNASEAYEAMTSHIARANSEYDLLS